MKSKVNQGASINSVVALLVDSIRAGTGGIASILQVAQTLSSQGYEVHLAVLRLDPLFLFHINRLKDMGYGKGIRIHYTPGFRIRIMAKLANTGILSTILLRLFQPDLIKSKDGVRRIIEALWEWVAPRGSRSLLKILNQSDYIIKALTLNGKELKYLKGMTCAKIIQNHAGSPETYEKYWLKKEHVIGDIDTTLPIYVRFCLAFDKILFQSNLQAQECARRHHDLEDKVVTVAPSCDELAISEARGLTSPYKERAVVIVNVGTLMPRKSQLDSIEIFAGIEKDYPDLELHFIGNNRYDKVYTKRLKQRTKDLHLRDKIFFHGHRDDYLNYMVHADCLIQTSRGEGVSRVLREAMFMRLPILSYSISGTQDLLENGVEALLISPGQIGTFSTMLSKLLKDKELGQCLAEAAYRRYLLKHSNAVYTENLISIFHKIGNQ